MADPNRSPPLDLQAFHRVRKLCLEGLSIPDIARSMGRSKAQIDKAVRFMGGVAKIREGATMNETEILGYTRHPASAVWPDLGENEYAALRENIRDQGQDHPILATADKRVIDGWHRLRACAEIPLDPRVITCHFDERDVARKVIGAHAGRRHMTQIDIARLTIETMKACGMEHRPNEGGRPSAEKPGQDGQVSRGAISAEGVARDANVSTRTARRAIQDDKRRSGLLPPRDAGTGTPTADAGAGAEPGSGTEPETGIPTSEENQGDAAPETPAPADDTGTAAREPASEETSEQTDAAAGDADPAPMQTIRRAVGQMQAFDPVDVVAGLEAELIGEFYDLGQSAVDVGFAMVRAAGPHRTQAATEAKPIPGSPAADDGSMDIPPFLDRRGEGGGGAAPASG